MNSNWKSIALNQLLKKSEEWVQINPAEIYKEVTVKLWGKGVVLRKEIEGAAIASTRRNRVRSGQFILSRIDARNGAFGLVPTFLDGAVVSNDFPVFTPNLDLIDAGYLKWLSKTKDFVDLCKRASEGTTNRVRLDEKKFLSLEIKIPLLPEQQRIVAHIESLATKIGEAQSIKKQAVIGSESFLDSVTGSIFGRIKPTDVKPLAALTSKIGSGSTPKGGRAFYPSSGIPFIRSLNVRMRRFQREGMVFIDQSTHESMGGTKTQPNDVLLNITGASIGRVACVPDDLSEANVNQHTAIIRPLSPLHHRYLMYWLSQPSVQDFINNEQKGATRQGFTKSQIESFKIPLISIDEQMRIVDYLDGLQNKLDESINSQRGTVSELDALLPSILDKAFKGGL